MLTTETIGPHAGGSLPEPCALPACHRRPAAEWRICQTCAAEVSATVRSLAEDYDECVDMLDRRPGWLSERVSGTRRIGISLSETAMAVRGDIVAILASWCALVAEEAGVPSAGSADVTVMATYLDEHLPWLATHPAVDDFADEITTLLADARRVLDPTPAKRVQLGVCAEPDCDRTVAATVYAAPGERQRRPVSCSAGHALPPRQWLLLSRWLRTAAANESLGTAA